MKRVLSVLALLCSLATGAQTGPQPLTVGDTVPPALFARLCGGDPARLLGFSGGVLILDFWATWCTSCLYSFPKLDSLRRQFSGRVEVVLVNAQSTGDTKEKVAAFFQRRKNKNGEPYTLPWIAEDTVFKALFPHRMLPHYVWIDPQGRVAAITGGEAVTEANIAALLQGRALSLPVKKDIMDYDPSLPLLESGNGGDVAGLLYRTVLTGYLEGLGSGTRRRSDSLRQKLTFINQSILSLYYNALHYPLNRVVLEVADSSRFFLQERPATGPRPVFSYEITAPRATSEEELRRHLLTDLDRYLGLRGRMEKRLTHCWVLTRTTQKDLLRSGGGKPEAHWNSEEQPYTCLRHQPFSRLVAYLNAQLMDTYPRPIVVDETGYSGPVDLTLHAPSTNLPALQKELRKYGLDLVPAQRELLVFVLTDQKTQKAPGE